MKHIEANKIIEDTRVDALECYMMSFIRAVLHGSDEHALWLAKAGQNYARGRVVNFENEYKK